MPFSFFLYTTLCFDDILSDILSPFIDILQFIRSLSNLFCALLSSYQQTDLCDVGANEPEASETYPTGPLLAFSYAGMLWSYYLGTVAFFRDHFDLHKSRICLSGISAGCSTVMVIFLDLSIEQGFEFGLEWNRLFNSRFLKFFALSTSQTLRMILGKFHKFGINDEILRQKYIKYGGSNAIHFGITAFSVSKLKMFHLLANDFSSLKQSIYAALCSMRIVPFFRSFGKYNGYYCCDGALTSNYSIPEIYRKKDNVIKIGILSKRLVSADIAPQTNFYPNEFIVAGDLSNNLIRFSRGYKDAAKFSNVLNVYIKKGLFWNHRQINPQTFNDVQFKHKWNQYIDDKIKTWNMKIIDHMKKQQ